MCSKYIDFELLISTLRVSGSNKELWEFETALPSGRYRLCIKNILAFLTSVSYIYTYVDTNSSKQYLENTVVCYLSVGTTTAMTSTGVWSRLMYISSVVMLSSFITLHTYLLVLFAPWTPEASCPLHSKMLICL